MGMIEKMKQLRKVFALSIIIGSPLSALVIYGIASYRDSNAQSYLAQAIEKTRSQIEKNKENLAKIRKNNLDVKSWSDFTDSLANITSDHRMVFSTDYSLFFEWGMLLSDAYLYRSNAQYNDSESKYGSCVTSADSISKATVLAVLFSETRLDRVEMSKNKETQCAAYKIGIIYNNEYESLRLTVDISLNEMNFFDFIVKRIDVLGDKARRKREDMLAKVLDGLNYSEKQRMEESFLDLEKREHPELFEYVINKKIDFFSTKHRMMLDELNYEKYLYDKFDADIAEEPFTVAYSAAKRPVSFKKRSLELLSEIANFSSGMGRSTFYLTPTIKYLSAELNVGVNSGIYIDQLIAEIKQHHFNGDTRKLKNSLSNYLNEGKDEDVKSYFSRLLRSAEAMLDEISVVSDQDLYFFGNKNEDILFLANAVFDNDRFIKINNIPEDNLVNDPEIIELISWYVLTKSQASNEYMRLSCLVQGQIVSSEQAQQRSLDNKLFSYYGILAKIIAINSEVDDTLNGSIYENDRMSAILVKNRKSLMKNLFPWRAKILRGMDSFNLRLENWGMACG